MFKHPLSLTLGLLICGVACKPVRQFEVPGAQLRARLLTSRPLAPGEQTRVEFEALWKDGKRLHSEAQGEAELNLSQLAYRGEGITYRSGKITLSKDPRRIAPLGAWAEFWVKTRPEVKTRLDIPTRFDISLVADHSGSSGFDGSKGRDGRDGASGANGSLGHSPTPGGHGEHGGDGEPGEHGRPGEAGQDVRVWVTLMPGFEDQLQIKVACGQRERFYRLDARRGSLLIKADGGDGGKGGQGGSGGRGGSGGLGSPKGRDGRDGLKGRSGRPGLGGDGGWIHCTVDPKAMPLMSAITFSNRGGRPMGEDGPEPIIIEQSVPALW